MGDRFPDFYIVGAPKSGTTSLLRYLDAHPQVFVPDRNEMHFFGSDLDIKGAVATCAEYLAFFADAAPTQIIGEKSVFYLFSSSAAEQIRRERSDAKIIVLLRHPADMIYSLHGQFLHSGNEDQLRFEDALALEGRRSQGKQPPVGAHNPGALQYTKVGAYREQVERYLSTFGPDQVEIQLFDTLRDDPHRCYADIAQFLGIDPSFEPTFDVYNASHAVPHLGARAWLRARPALHRMAHRVIPRSVRARLGEQLSLRQAQRPGHMNPDTRASLTMLLSDDIRWLRDELGLPVEHWL